MIKMVRSNDYDYDYVYLIVFHFEFSLFSLISNSISKSNIKSCISCVKKIKEKHYQVSVVE